MNCCNDFGQCTCGMGEPPAAPTAQQRSCDALGVCQQRFPACGGCLASHDTARMTERVATGPQPRYSFAPGVVEGYRAPFLGTAAQRRELKRAGFAVLWWLAGCTLAAFALGLVVGMTA
jgi:hypothetical protein